MSTNTLIEWTDTTWNPTRGCTVVSEGCRNCYAMKQAHRFSGPGKPYEGLTELRAQGPWWTGKIRLVHEALEEPLHWKKPRRVFVNSMSDLFHEDVPDEFIADAFAVMARCQHHVFQILTKRPARMVAFCSKEAHWWGNKAGIAREPYYNKPLPNVWLGVSVEDQKTADERIPLLLQTPAAVQFLSCEPLLSNIDIRKWLGGLRIEREAGSVGKIIARKPRGIDWVILGGESGPGARCCDIASIRSIKDQCQAVGVPVFVKQLGLKPSCFCSQCGRSIGRGVLGGFVDACGPTHAQLIHEMLRIRDGKGGDWTEWPEDLKVREYPMTAHAQEAR